MRMFNVRQKGIRTSIGFLVIGLVLFMAGPTTAQPNRYDHERGYGNGPRDNRWPYGRDRHRQDRTRQDRYWNDRYGRNPYWYGYYYEPPVVYAPPVVHAPPPVYYDSPGLNLIIPLDLR